MGWINKSVEAVWSLWHPRAEGDGEARVPSPSDDYWYQGFPEESQAGIRITPGIALKASALHACIKILAETIASVPLQMYQRQADGGREEAPGHPLDDLLRYQPNSWQTAAEFWETVMFHAALNGGGYSEILPGRRGAVDQLIPVFDGRVEQMEDYSLVFDVWDARLKRRKKLLQEEVFRIPGLSTDGVRGLRAVDLAADAIGLGLAQDAYAAKVFKNGWNIGGFLVHPERIGPEAEKNLVHALALKYAGLGNSHRPMVLQEGLDWKGAGQTNEEAQLTDARKWQIGEIARHFRIPLHMLGIDDQTNRSTVGEQALGFVKYSIRPWTRRIEQAIRRDLILFPERYEAKFNLEGLLRGDAKTRAEYFAKALGSGGSPAWMSPNEVRVIEGMNRDASPHADQLGQGTNPRTGDGAGASNAASLPSPPLMIADQRLEALTLSAAERLVRKEVAAIRKATERCGDDVEAFEDWAETFYEAHVRMVDQVLQLGDEPARAYADHQRVQALGAFESGQIEALLERWETRRAAELTACLMENAA